jgi:hypothetical protein
MEGLYWRSWLPIPIRTFSYQELILATNNLDHRLILRREWMYTFYKGSFEGQNVSIRSYSPNYIYNPKPPQAFGGGPATPKGQKKRKKWVWDFGDGRTTPKGLGVASATPYDHPLGPGGGFGTPPTGRRGWPKPPLGPWRWSGHPQNPKPIFSFFFFFFWPFGVAGPPPKVWGGFGHPHMAGSATPWPKMGWSGHPISG